MRGPTTTSTLVTEPPLLSGRLPRFAFWLFTAVASNVCSLDCPSTTCVSSPAAEYTRSRLPSAFTSTISTISTAVASSDAGPSLPGVTDAHPDTVSFSACDP